MSGLGRALGRVLTRSVQNVASGMLFAEQRLLIIGPKYELRINIISLTFTTMICDIVVLMKKQKLPSIILVLLFSRQNRGQIF